MEVLIIQEAALNVEEMINEAVRKTISKAYPVKKMKEGPFLAPREVYKFFSEVMGYNRTEAEKTLKRYDIKPMKICGISRYSWREIQTKLFP